MFTIQTTVRTRRNATARDKAQRRFFDGFDGFPGLSAYLGRSLLLLFLLSPVCWGQPAPSTPPADGTANDTADAPPPTEQPAEPAAPQPVAPADITSAAVEASTELDRLERQLEPSPVVVELSADVAAHQKTIQQLQKDLDGLNSATASPRQIEDARAQWRRLEEQLNRDTARADERWQALQATREQLQKIKTQWESTRDAEATADLPQEVRDRILSIITRAEALLGQAQQRLDVLASLIEQLSEARETATTALQRIRDVSHELTQNLLTRNAPPLWQMPGADWQGLENTAQTEVRTWFRDLGAFVAERWIRLLVHLAVLIALIGTALAAGRSSVDWPEEDESLDRARFLVSRPLSIALIFGVLAGAFIYSDPPTAVRDFFHLLILIPMLRLAKGLASKTERAVLYGLVGVLALHLLMQLAPAGSLLARLLLLGVQGAAIGVLGQALWRARLFSRGGQPWRRILWGAACLAALALVAVGLSANVLGWINLARFLTESTILTAEAALLALLFVRAGGGLLPAITRYGLGRVLLSVRRHREGFERVAYVSLALLLLFLWSRGAFRRFRLWEELQAQTRDALATPLSWSGTEITSGDVLQAVVILVVAVAGQRLVRFALQEEIFPRLNVAASSAAIFVTLSNYAIVGIGLILSGSAIGLTGTQLTVLFGALGVGIGFGLQNIVNNFISGLILIFEQPIKVGDILESGGVWGTVKRIGVRATVLRTFDGAEILVPNGDLISKEIKNWTLTDAASRVEVLVGVAYGSDVQQVLDILERVAAANELVMREPKPLPLMVGFGDSSLNFRLLCWVKIDDRFTAVSQLHVAVNEALAEAGITIPFPQRDLHVRSIEANAELEEFVRNRS